MATQTSKLEQAFDDLDIQQYGYINQAKLQKFMNAMQYYHIKAWKINQIFVSLNQKMSKQNFIIWALGCKYGLDQFACFKFKFQSQFNKLIQDNQSAGPSNQSAKFKKSSIDFQINTQKYSDKLAHFLKLVFQLNRQKNKSKSKQLTQVLEKDVSDIFFFIKLKTIKNGQSIAEKLNDIVQMGLDLCSELGQSVTSVIQNITLTTKYYNGFVYIILQLKNTFFTQILRYFQQAAFSMSSDSQLLLSITLQSSFTNILQQSFNIFNQPMCVNTQFVIDCVSMQTIKKSILKDFPHSSSDQKVNTMFMFLFQELKLKSTFGNLNQCCQKMGFSQEKFPKPQQYAKELKSYQIRDNLAQFLPQGFFQEITQFCQPQGQVGFYAKLFSIQLDFQLVVKGLMDLL